MINALFGVITNEEPDQRRAGNAVRVSPQRALQCPKRSTLPPRELRHRRARQSPPSSAAHQPLCGGDRMASDRGPTGQVIAGAQEARGD